ncbi:MAG: hypothetical protein DCC67_12475 [Planctomycetota bacterium]|nr:MAG: hypothetical protein DCC67_12475 [Planctomycetota bacterium]
MRGRAAIVIALVLLALAVVPHGYAQAGEPPGTTLRATPVTPPGAAPQTVRFQQQPTQAGDRAVQSLAIELGLTTRITQSGQIAHESQSTMRREQRRTLEVLEVSEGRATKTRATFDYSRRQSPEGPHPAELARQPIEGKSYLAIRIGDELSITDLSGAVPPAEELKLVAESLENVGKPNPLASLLVNRQVAVGERIFVPRDLVQELLGFEDPIGAVRKFELTLRRIEPADAATAATRAVFDAALLIVPNDASPLSIQLAGVIAVEVDTCRLAHVELKGPVQLSSIERTRGGIFQYSAGGELNLAIASQYGRTEVASRSAP